MLRSAQVSRKEFGFAWACVRSAVLIDGLMAEVLARPRLRLTRSQWLILHMLAHPPKAAMSGWFGAEATATALGLSLAVPRSTIATQLRGMAQRKLVEQPNKAQDRVLGVRKFAFRLTPKGAAVYREIDREMAKIDDLFARLMTQKDRRDARRKLADVLAELEGIVGPHRMMSSGIHVNNVLTQRRQQSVPKRNSARAT